MREIKFRGRTPSGKWVYGDLHIRTIHPHIHTEPCSKAIIDSDTVGQFTGFKDNTGKEIYEGDIVKFMAHDGLGNELGTQQGIIRYQYGGYLIGGCDMYDILLNDDEAEIIGNIHDNPELLKSL